MEINTVVVQIALVFLPSLVWSSIVDQLTTHAKREAFEVITRAFVFGLLSYLIYCVIHYLWTKGTFPPMVQWVDGPRDKDLLGHVGLKDLLRTTATSVLCAVFWAWGFNRKLFIRLMQWLGITRKFGDEDVWNYVFNMDSAAVEYVNVRDFERSVVYCGFVRGFSDTTVSRELLLEDVKVYNMDSNLLFEMPLLYLSRPSETLHIEFPFAPPRPPAGAKPDEPPAND